MCCKTWDYIPRHKCFTAILYRCVWHIATTNISESLTQFCFFCSPQQIYTAQVLQDPYSEEVTGEEDSHRSLLDVQHAQINQEDG